MAIIYPMIKTFNQICHQHASPLCSLFAGVLLFSLAMNSWAANDKNTESIEKIFISADHMQLNLETGHSVYTGNVKISQGELILTGDKVTLKQSNDEIERLTVSGKPVQYSQVNEKGEAVDAESERMVYIASQNKLIMTINARLQQTDHQVSSQKIVYDTLKRIVIAGDISDTSTGEADYDEKQRVNITLTPKK